MQNGLGARPEPARTKMGIRVAAQQNELKKEHAGRPHAGPAAEPWQDILADQRLHLEQQEGPGANSQREGEHRFKPFLSSGRKAHATVALSPANLRKV